MRDCAGFGLHINRESAGKIVYLGFLASGELPDFPVGLLVVRVSLQNVRRIEIRIE